MHSPRWVPIAENRAERRFRAGQGSTRACVHLGLRVCPLLRSLAANVLQVISACAYCVCAILLEDDISVTRVRSSPGRSLAACTAIRSVQRLRIDFPPAGGPVLSQCNR